MQEKKALIIFTRNPEMGVGKRRLAATVGDQIAYDVYVFLLNRTKEIALDVQAQKQLYYSEKIHHGDMWPEDDFMKYVQDGDDLGMRMRNAFAKAKELNYDKIIIIGSDLYDLTSEDIENAYQEMDNHDVVIGPAVDGGYYLLGMKTVHESLFLNKEWGTDTVLRDTLNDIKEVKYTLLEPRNDVDYYEDIKDVPAFQPLLKEYYAK